MEYQLMKVSLPAEMKVRFMCLRSAAFSRFEKLWKSGGIILSESEGHEQRFNESACN